jgi:opacity protein-like surface antigen
VSCNSGNSMKKTLAAMILGMLAMASAHSAIVTINFTGINSQATYSESGLNFSVTGNHTDASDFMYFHDGGINPGDTDLITVQAGGAAFSVLSLDLIYSFGSSIVGSNGLTISIADDYSYDPSSMQTIGVNLLDVTSVTFRTSSSGLAFDNLVIDTAPRAVPEPATLALVAGGLLAGAAARRRRRAR